MERKDEICLLNDSFPPTIDGVANTVMNYARVIQGSGEAVSVVTPDHPEADDSAFPYPVIRYPALDLRKRIGYTAGNPFDLRTLMKLQGRKIGLLHSHCPAMSNIMARSLRESLDVPLIMTYHTKYDIDIAKLVKNKGLQHGAIKALVDSVRSTDELWVVSRGAGENIRSLGYQGDYLVMPNGVDMPRGRLSEERIRQAIASFALRENVPLFLFVGRLMWYKGVKTILDALAALHYAGRDFQMVFVGSGGDEEEIRAAVKAEGLSEKVFFTGPIRERETLSAWYCRADLLLFPSTFDTNGLVVREAAACGLGAVLVDGSCAAEGVRDGEDALLIQDSAASLALCLAEVMERRDFLKELGAQAAENLYYSWDDSVHSAMERYEIVKEKFLRGDYKKKHTLSDEFFVISGDLLEFLEEQESRRREFIEKLGRAAELLEDRFEELLDDEEDN